jgi:hypothetical protein
MYLNARMCKSKNLAILICRGIMTAVLPLMVTLIIDHSYLAFTQCIILRTKKSKWRENFSQSIIFLEMWLKFLCHNFENLYNLWEIFLLLKLLTWLYHVSTNSDDVSLFLIFQLLEDFALSQPFCNKLNNQLKNVWCHIEIDPFTILNRHMTMINSTRLF